MSNAFAQIIQSKEAERRRLRGLPWLEKLELLDRLQERQLLLAKMRSGPPRQPQAQVQCAAREKTPHSAR